MGFGVVGRFIVAGAILAIPAAGYAQEAVLSGTVTDSTGAVLPGVTIRAVHEATGNSFDAVTDERGAYRIPVRVGTYQVRAAFRASHRRRRPAWSCSSDRRSVVNLQMAPVGVAEDRDGHRRDAAHRTTTSSLGGNIDPSQVQELPVNGRNWMALALLAPGSRTNPAPPARGQTPLPDRNGGEAREFQLNVDGQQVSADIGVGGQPKYSQDSIAEFQFISNRFDATMGRSTGVQVNAITKSGSNQLSGLFRGNFRNSRFNADEPGPEHASSRSTTSSSARRSAVRSSRTSCTTSATTSTSAQPQTFIYNTPYPAFNIDHERARTARRRPACASTTSCRRRRA